jgi:hypothetical protein
VLRFSPGPADHLILADGEQTFTAADGDELDAEFENAVLNTTTGIAIGVFRFVGGTGRFAEASGSAVFVVEQNLITGEFEVTAVGHIDF